MTFISQINGLDISASYAITASYALSSSYVLSSSFASTASYVNPLNQDVIITGSIYIPDNTYGIYFSGSGAASKLLWNDVDGTLNLGLKGGVVSSELGQGLVTRIVNKTTPNIYLSGSNYQVVVVAGAQGQRLAVKLAQANNDVNSAGTLGIVAENIDKNQEGFIVTVGLLKNRNTTGALQGETWNDGDILYLSPTTAGAITNIKPQAPNHTVIVGYVEYAHSVNGKIYVKIDNGYELDELHNVKITTSSLVPGQLLIRSGSNGNGGVWINSNQLTGSYGLTGSLEATSFTGSLFGTASWAIDSTRARSSSYATSAGNASTIDINVFGSNVDSYLLMSNVAGLPGVAIGGDADLRYNTSTNVLTVGNISATTLTGSLLGTSSWAASSLTASYVNTLNQNLIISGNITPAGPYVSNTSSYNLGSPTAAWNKIYVSNNSLHIVSGSVSASIGFNNGVISFNDATINVPAGSTVLTSSFATTSSYATVAQTLLGSVTSASYAATASKVIGGTTNYIPLWTAGTTLGSSVLYQSGTSIGLGTISPNTILHISGTSAQPLVNIENNTPTGYTNMRFTGTGRKYIIGVGNASESTFGIANDFFLYDDTSGNIRMIVDPNGQIGIGTTSPASALHVIGNITASGNITAQTNLVSANSSGDEGGEILLAKAVTNTTLTGSGITIDSYQNRVRFFEQGGTSRGAYIDLTACAGGASTNLLTPSTGVSFAGSGSIITGSTAISSSYGLLVPANTFTVGDIVKIQGIFTKPNAASSMNFYIYINTSNSLSGATQLALYQTTTQRWNPITRTLAIESATSTTLHPTNVAHYNDDIVLTAATARASVNIDWTVAQYILFAAQNATVGDRTDTFRFYAKRI